MEYSQLKKYIGSYVELTTVDDMIFRGKLTNTESEFDTESGKEEVEMQGKNSYIGFPFDEIKNIVEIPATNEVF